MTGLRRVEASSSRKVRSPHRQKPKVPFGHCKKSQHADGNHSRNWFDGGTCKWCGAK